MRLRGEQARPGAWAGSQVADSLEAVGLSASIDAGEAFASGYVDSILRRLEEDVVRVTGTVEFGDRRARIRVEHEDLGWAPAADEEAVMLFVERHWKVLGVRKSPPGQDPAVRAIDHHHLVFPRYVHEDSRSSGLELERLRVPSEGDLGDHFSALGIECDERTRPASTFAYPEKIGTGLVSDVVRVRTELDPGRPCEIAAFEHRDAGAFAIRHEELPIRGEKDDALRLSEPLETRNMAIPHEVDHLQGAVPERRHEQSVVPNIERQMIDPTHDSRKRNPGDLARQGPGLRADGSRQPTSVKESTETDRPEESQGRGCHLQCRTTETPNATRASPAAREIVIGSFCMPSKP